jgi:DNA-directed RNA polymerase subunit F
MIGKKILDDREIPLSEVKNILAKRKKEGELSYEQKAALDYSSEFGTSQVTKSRALIEELCKIEGVDHPTSVMIADVKPKDKDDLRVIMEKKRFTMSDGDVKKILDLVAEYSVE